ncbi:MAG: hypothetical protein KKA42_16190, partial [candidate division Zixibacteria bacterium]|nr:hypothetical protein [candidate division Zixibacteria bacterium]
MTRLTTVCTALLLLVCLTTAGARVNPTGSTQIAKNHEVNYLLEGDNGVPEFVSGKLVFGVTKGSEITSAISFFETNKAAYRMHDPAKELVVQRVDTDRLGMQHVRLSQYHDGVRVEGGQLLAHYKADGTLETVNGFYLPDIELDTRATVTIAEATALAVDDLAGFFGAGTPDDAELVVFPWDGEYFLCWRTTLWSDAPMGRWEYYVNAKNGDVVFKANRIQDAEAIGTGTGVLFGTRSHIDTWDTGSEYQMIDYTRQAANNIHGHNGQMPPGNYVQTNYANPGLPGAVATDPDNAWDTYSPQSAAVDAHVFATLVYDWMLTEFGRNSFDDNGASMLSTVNYSLEGNNNAYWNGSQIVIWSFSSGNRSLAGCPDVVAHEWGHAVTDYTSDL